MQFLKFFLDWGKHGLGALWLPYIFVSVILLYQYFKARKNGWYKNSPSGNTAGTGKLPWYKYHTLVGWMLITLAAIIIHFVIQASYK